MGNILLAFTVFVHQIQEEKEAEFPGDIESCNAMGPVPFSPSYCVTDSQSRNEPFSLPAQYLGLKEDDGKRSILNVVAVRFTLLITFTMKYAVTFHKISHFVFLTPH